MSEWVDERVGAYVGGLVSRWESECVLTVE